MLEVPLSRRLNKSSNINSASPAVSNKTSETPGKHNTEVTSSSDLKSMQPSQELERLSPSMCVSSTVLLLASTLQAPPSPKVVRRLVKEPNIDHTHSQSDISFSEEGNSDHKVAGNSLSTIRNSKLTWSCISTDSGVSSKSYSSQQHPVSSASSVDAIGGISTPSSRSKASSSLEVSRKDDRPTHFIKQSVNFRFLGRKKCRNKLEPLPSLLVPLYPGEAHGNIYFLFLHLH